MRYSDQLFGSPPKPLAPMWETLMLIRYLHFGLQEDQLELVHRREVARAEGIGPGDPLYPDIFDVRPFK